MAKQKLGFIVNMNRCIGCNACVISCKSYNQVQAKINRRTITEVDENLTENLSRGYISVACNHCEAPACAKACPTGAYTKLENGTVQHNVEVCIGCQMCNKACPYKAPKFNEETKKMDKCHMCSPLLEQGKAPICVASCPMEALEIADFTTIDESLYVKTVEGFPDISISTPNIRFILPKTGIRIRREK